METESFHPPPLSSDDETDDESDSFEEWQLIGAETENTEQLLVMEGLCISGEARPGHTIYVAGYSLNGTVRCDCAWLRLYDNGSQIHIPGGKKPEHLVTADDVDSYLAVEVIPIGKEDQMGDLVRVFANEHKKVTCGNEMQDAVEQNFFDGHASFDVRLLVYGEDPRTAKLECMKDKFIIKDKKMHPVVKMNFLPEMAITISEESPTGFEIHSREAFRSIKLEAKSSWQRDLTVLTMRTFLLRAIHKAQKKKRRKRCFFL